MPFGMMNSGATLVRGMKKVLEGLSEVSSYIDDIAVYNDSWEEHLRTLKELTKAEKSWDHSPTYEMLARSK